MTIVRRRGQRLLASLVLVLWGGSPASLARAWGPEGHRIVGDIAQRHMSARANAELTRLLGHGSSLAEIANDADDYRAKCRNTGPWHYVNIPLDASAYVPARDCPAEAGGCVLSALERELSVLRDHSQPEAERRFALRFVVHLVGDLHQPLHSADRGDRGGNDVPLRFRGQLTNLHKLWDLDLMNASHRTRASFGTPTPSEAEPARVRALQQGGPVDWALEAREVARQFVYGKLPRAVDGELELPAAYLEAVMPALDTQLVRAGLRLALLLESALTRPGPKVAADVIGQQHVCAASRSPSKRSRTNRHRRKESVQENRRSRPGFDADLGQTFTQHACGHEVGRIAVGADLAPEPRVEVEGVPAHQDLYTRAGR